MTDIILESVRAIVLLILVIFLFISGRGRFHQFQRGWTLILLGFSLLLFGSILDITDNFPSLNPWIFIGDTEVEAFLEKFVGFLGGFVFLAIGLVLWIPQVQNMAQLVDERTRDLQAANDKLSQEIAERKRAELVKQEFTSTVNHELRTPLTSIKGALGLIRTGTIAPLPDQTLALLDIAYRNGERLEALINDLLDVEKLETGEMVFTLAPLDIRALIDEAIELNQECCEKYDVTFSLGDCAPNAWVEGDRDRLLQVMSNLMSNAAKFSESGKAVEITLATKNGAVRTSVRNYGKVIPKTVGNHIFEKFSQLNTSDNRQVGGTGLGLSIAKSIVEEHSGSIGYHSNATDGTTFYFALPSIDR